MIKVKIELDSSKIKILQDATKKAFELTVEEVLSDLISSQVIPKETGELERSGFVQIESMVARIIFDTPYARRLYWHPEYNFRHDKNQYAGGFWMHQYIDGEKRNFVKKTFEMFLKQEGGALIT